MSFPTTARYFLNFRVTDIGVSPSFMFFKSAADLSNITPQPTIYEVGGGVYYFDWYWNSASDDDIVYMADNNDSIAPPAERFIRGVISPRDRTMDVAVSSVPSSVWSDSATYVTGTKGLRLDQLGDPVDTSAEDTLFGHVLLSRELIRGDTAGTQDGKSAEDAYDAAVAAQELVEEVKGIGFTSSASLSALKVILDTVQERTDNLPDDPASQAVVANALSLLQDEIKGGDDRSLTDLAGAGFTGSSSLKAISDKATDIYDAIDPAAISDAIWSKDITAYATAGQAAEVLLRVLKYLANKVSIDTIANTMTVYEDDGVTVLAEFTLSPSAATPYMRTPIP